jgi:hypothetical protein
LLSRHFYRENPLLTATDRDLPRASPRVPAAWAIGAAALLAVGLSACGAVESTAVLMDAEARIAAAYAAGAPDLSPYEFYGAEAHLVKAREEAGYADFEVAIDYGNKAIELANQATANTQKQKGPR